MLAEGVGGVDEALELASRSWPWSDGPMPRLFEDRPVTASVGVAFHEPAPRPNSCLIKADIAMYVARRQEATGWSCSPNGWAPGPTRRPPADGGRVSESDGPGPGGSPTVGGLQVIE